MKKWFTLVVCAALLVGLGMWPAWAGGDKVRSDKAQGEAGETGNGLVQTSRGVPVGGDDTVQLAGAPEDATGKNGPSQKPVALTEAEEKDLIHLREEEKLARDVYRHLYDQWGQWIFDHIAASEQKHMDAVKNLLDRYAVNDPVGDHGEGEFQNADLQDLYDQLIEIGSQDKTDALWVGATIEDMDIYDIQQMLMRTDKPDLILVYENLMKGSRNHLRAFCGLLASLGEDPYLAQYLSQAEVDEILSGDKETGRR